MSYHFRFRLTVISFARITKLRDQCGTQWDEHWSCLQKRNQEYFKCRQPEHKLNECVFEKLVCLVPTRFLLVSLTFVSGSNKENPWIASESNPGSRKDSSNLQARAKVDRAMTYCCPTRMFFSSETRRYHAKLTRRCRAFASIPCLHHCPNIN